MSPASGFVLRGHREVGANPGTHLISMLPQDVHWRAVGAPYKGNERKWRAVGTPRRENARTWRAAGAPRQNQRQMACRKRAVPNKKGVISYS